MTWPRSVESLRLISCTGPPSWSPSSNSERPALRLTATASASVRLRVLVSTKQVEPASARPAAYSARSRTVTTATSCTVCDPVGSSSSTAIRRPTARLAARIRDRASALACGSGRAAKTSSADGSARPSWMVDIGAPWFEGRSGDGTTPSPRRVSEDEAQRRGGGERGEPHDRLHHRPGLQRVLLADPEQAADEPEPGVVDVRCRGRAGAEGNDDQRKAR